jgi:peptidoglycan/LPS O-acetylase OafA/YrhL
MPATSPPRTPRHLPGLDGLRGLAAAAVVVLHVWMYTTPVAERRGGAVGAVIGELRLGVIAFFVMSAFLLVRPWLGAAAGGRPLPRAGAFLLRRAARILPGYWLALLGAFALLRDTGSGRAAGAGQLPVLALLAQFQVDGARLLLVPQSWSLAVELSFYALLPLAGWALVRTARRAGPRAGALLVAGALIAAGLAWGLLAETGRWPVTTTTSLPGYLPIFGCGIAAAVLPVPGRAGARRCLLVLGALLVVLDGRWHSQGTGLLGHVVGDLPAAAGFGIFVAALAAGPAGLLERAPLRWLGTVSFGVYLWHLPVLYALLARELLPADTAAAYAVVMVPSLALAAMSWYGLERPVMRWAGRRGSTQPLAGSERAYATPRLTHGSSVRFVPTPAASTRSHPCITRPRISIGPACGRPARASVSSGSTRTMSPPLPLAATAMWPATRNAKPPNIRFSVTSGSPAISSRMRFARSSS